MRFLVLGPVGVFAGGRRITLARGQQRTILAMLLAGNGEVVTTDRLVDTLWGSAPPHTARKSLQSHVSRLRHLLLSMAPGERDPLESAPDGYRMDLAVHEFDAHLFRDLVEQAKLCSDPRETLSLLERAEGCWDGPAFGDLAAHPGLEAPARHLDQQRNAAAAERHETLLTLGRHDDAARALSRVVEAEPFDERAHGQLMRALVATGRRAEALATFRQVQTRLRDELGVDPSSELRGLHEHILRQDTESSVPAPPPNRTAELVRRSDPLLGRERDLETVGTWLRSASLVTLTGPGGIGKTRLAERLVEHTRDIWRDGVISCALAHVRDAEGVGGALITALAIQPSGGHSVTDALVSGLGDRHLLLFLDNCEHVLDAVTPHVEAIVDACPGTTVLVTTRERLHLRNERVWPVTPLDVPPENARPTDVTATSAGSLFRMRALAVDPAFRLNDANAGAVAELCRRLDGMPLAIELAAARTRALTPAALAQRLDQRFAVLAGGPRHEGGRHRTLEAVVAWSYELLAPEEADLFDRLAVFAGAVPLASVEAVCSAGHLPHTAIAGLLGELVDKSMVVVQRDGEDVRYRLLDTMRDFGLRRLEDRGLADALRRAHAAHHVTLAETQARRSRGPEEPEAAEVITRAMDDLRAAHAWAVAAEDVDTALRLPAALADEVFFRLRDEVTTWARRAVALAGAGDHPAHAGALATAAWGATSRDECERAVREAQTSLAEVEPGGAVALLALGALGTAALYQGRLAEVLALTDRQEVPAVALDDDFRLTYAWVCRVLGHLYRGETEEAAAGVPQLRRIAERSGSPTMRAFSRYCDGEVHLERDPDRATASLEEAVALARSVNNRLIEGVSLVCLASSQGRRGQVREALHAFRDVVVHWRQVGDHTHQLTAVRNLVELLAEMEADEPAAVLYGAVTSGDTPTYGLEAQRLTRAWQRVEERLGHETADALAERGQRLGVRRVGDEALARLDVLLET
ncbi:putative ATPase [Haloactinopolyspora alba]|uniref:Putative ATPase n=1 Tax=Haloactinopolyspora alba TaxID=648780 RepID=A0A2P8E592_9ACTN|nr:BTAD domain-containing putative transcriptional regulator [Haloactinopolyspora alba]PSL04622.1 putative ATPase [Haloactinopolyspora alba]